MIMIHVMTHDTTPTFYRTLLHCCCSGAMAERPRQTQSLQWFPNVLGHWANERQWSINRYTNQSQFINDRKFEMTRTSSGKRIVKLIMIRSCFVELITEFWWIIFSKQNLQILSLASLNTFQPINTIRNIIASLISKKLVPQGGNEGYEFFLYIFLVLTINFITSLPNLICDFWGWIRFILA